MNVDCRQQLYIAYYVTFAYTRVLYLLSIFQNLCIYYVFGYGLFVSPCRSRQWMIINIIIVIIIIISGSRGISIIN